MPLFFFPEVKRRPDWAFKIRNTRNVNFGPLDFAQTYWQVSEDVYVSTSVEKMWDVKPLAINFIIQNVGVIKIKCVHKNKSRT